MHDGIIGVPLKWNLRIVRRQPSIKRIMQKQVGQQWTDHAALRRALLTRNQRLLRTEAAVHVPERIMRQIASRIIHEGFRLNYQIPSALACRGSNVEAP